MPKPFNHRSFHRRRKLFKVIGLLLVLGGLFTLLNMMGELPDEPLKGYNAVFAGAVLILFGIIFLYEGYKLPLAEAIELIHERGRGVTESELVHDMRVDRVTAGRIIRALVDKGFLRRASDQSSQTEEVFEPVR
ncbi:MAG TPA: MarR family transcriptional regulator [Verrucomicrobiae bacterium]|nr:MarR family transcriptional regulator [Verrucomicrobiae bacterium]